MEKMYSKEWWDKGDDGGVRLQGGGAGRGVRMNRSGRIEEPPVVSKDRPGGGLDTSKPRLKSDAEEAKGGLHTDTLGGYARQLEASMAERGGYPTRGGKPMMTKRQQREAARRASSDDDFESDYKFAQGGIVNHVNKSYRLYGK